MDIYDAEKLKNVPVNPLFPPQEYVRHVLFSTWLHIEPG
jgi:hypothetical protein